MTTSATGSANRPERSKAVVILGAGFSHALYAPCPTTDGLGEEVRARLAPFDREKMPTGKFTGGRFEEWLSYLSEPQPHHDVEEAAEATAFVLRVTRMIREMLTEVQDNGLLAEPPPWFFEFLSVLHVLRARVITLNYDNFVECGTQSLGLQAPDWRGPIRVEEHDILGGIPATAVPPPSEIVNQTFGCLIPHPRSDPGPADTFRLMKLHGSLSWYWLPEGGGSSTLRRWYLPGVLGQLWDQKEELRRQELPAHEVFIVPPAALKGQSLKEPVTRELWRRAAEAIQDADRVVLMGYSVPLADHSLVGMLSEGLQGRHVDIEIVNPRPCVVEERLLRLGIGSVDIKQIAGEDCIEQWTKDEVKRLAAETLGEIRCDPDLTGDEVLWVDGPRPERCRSVNRAGSDGEPTVLYLNPRGQQLTTPLRLSDVREAFANSSDCVIADESRRFPIIGYWRLNDGPMRTPQLHLVTAGL